MRRADNRSEGFVKDGVAHCTQCNAVVDIQQGTTVKAIRHTWMRMNVTGRCGHEWVVRIG